MARWVVQNSEDAPKHGLCPTWTEHETGTSCMFQRVEGGSLLTNKDNDRT